MPQDKFPHPVAIGKALYEYQEAVRLVNDCREWSEKTSHLPDISEDYRKQGRSYLPAAREALRKLKVAVNA